MSVLIGSNIGKATAMHVSVHLLWSFFNQIPVENLATSQDQLSFPCCASWELSNISILCLLLWGKKAQYCHSNACSFCVCVCVWCEAVRMSMEPSFYPMLCHAYIYFMLCVHVHGVFTCVVCTWTHGYTIWTVLDYTVCYSWGNTGPSKSIGKARPILFFSLYIDDICVWDLKRNMRQQDQNFSFISSYLHLVYGLYMVQFKI